MAMVALIFLWTLLSLNMIGKLEIITLYIITFMSLVNHNFNLI